MFTATAPVRIDTTGVRTGGTLRLHGSGDPVLDPACLDDTASAQLVRLYARQLFTYQPDPDPRSWQAIAPVPDLAAQIPSIYNAGLGASGTTYVVHLRPGVRWDTAVPRTVTAYDVIRGFKRLANPVRPAPTLGYFTSTIRGMAQFHAEYAAAVGPDASAAELAAFQNSHEIAGIFALDGESLVFELVRPILDFISILALPPVVPAPVEYDAFVPGSPQLAGNLRATGPYRLTGYARGSALTFEPNPVWRQDTDPVRRQFLDRIEVGLGGSVPAGVDLAWNARVPEPYTDPPADPANGLGWGLDPYLVFNLRRPGPLRDVAVRRSIAAAVDRSAVAEAVAGLRTGTAIRVARGIVPPDNDAYTGREPESTSDGRIDGLALTAIHPDTPEATVIARSYAADLERVGATVRLVALSPPAHRERVADPYGDWDLTTLSCAPAWHYQNGRVFLQRLFQGGADSTGNRGGYHEPEVDELIERALDSIDPRHANALWQQVEQRVLADVPVVPLLFQTPAVRTLRSERVRDAVAMPSLGYADDLCTLWLDY